MLSGVGMTDIFVGRALWNDLVRQVAVRTRGRDDTAPVDNAGAFLLRAAINPDIDNRRHSRALKTLAITHRLEDSTPLQNEVVGTQMGSDKPQPMSRQIILTCNLYEFQYNLGESGRSSRITH
jgi:hypothetical protein